MKMPSLGTAVAATSLLSSSCAFTGYDANTFSFQQRAGVTGALCPATHAPATMMVAGKPKTACLTKSALPPEGSVTPDLVCRGARGDVTTVFHPAVGYNFTLNPKNDPPGYSEWVRAPAATTPAAESRSCR